MLKTCTKCGIEKPLTRKNFREVVRQRKTGVFVTWRGECLICDRERARSHQSVYRNENKAALAAARKVRCADPKRKAARNAVDLATRQRKRFAANEDAERARLIRRLLVLMQRRAESLEWPAGKPSQLVCWLWNRPGMTEAQRYAARYRLDAEFQIAERIRRQINKRRKRDDVADIMRSALVRGGKSSKVQQLLGYTIAELHQHLERQFTDGMDWPAFASGAIHIDHIIPQSSFDLSNENEWRACWCLSNLRPVWADENRAKSDKVLFLL